MINRKVVFGCERIESASLLFSASDRFYAQARYLCYYLQQKGLLVKFYHEFTANQKEDPTGYKTLTKILGEKDMAAFKKKWERFVLELTFP